MAPQLYRPESAVQRRLFIAASALVAVGGVIILAGAFPNMRHTAFLGAVLLIVSFLNITRAWSHYPPGFQMPEGIDPSDVRAVFVAVRRYRRERPPHT